MKARYDAIYREIRDSIEQGVYPYQSFLPSEAELTAAFSCSHNTIRRALGVLREQGYVQPVHGKGVRVIYQEPERTTFTVGGIESFHEADERIRLHAQTEVVTLEQVVATENPRGGPDLHLRVCREEPRGDHCHEQARDHRGAGHGRGPHPA